MKSLVCYYSNTGNNAFMAKKCAQALDADCEALHPRIPLFPVVMITSLLPAGPGIRALDHTPEEYDRVILWGPIWMGQVVFPLTSFCKRYRRSITRIHFATVCGSNDTAKDDRFGYASVFTKFTALLPDATVSCTAFPVGLVLPDDRQDDGDLVMKTRFTNDNFSGKLETRFNRFIDDIRSDGRMPAGERRDG